MQFVGLVSTEPVVQTNTAMWEESYQVLVILYYVVALDTQISETKGQLDESLKANYLWLSKASYKRLQKAAHAFYSAVSQPASRLLVTDLSESFIYILLCQSEASFLWFRLMAVC